MLTTHVPIINDEVDALLDALDVTKAPPLGLARSTREVAPPATPLHLTLTAFSIPPSNEDLSLAVRGTASHRAPLQRKSGTWMVAAWIAFGALSGIGSGYAASRHASVVRADFSANVVAAASPLAPETAPSPVAPETASNQSASTTTAPPSAAINAPTTTVTNTAAPEASKDLPTREKKGTRTVKSRAAKKG